MQRAVVVLLLILGVGCASFTSPTYDTHESYDARVEQWGKDHSEWLAKRRANSAAWRDGVLKPAMKRLDPDQSEERRLEYESECGSAPDKGNDDSEYRECRQTIFDKHLAENYDRYETFDEFVARHGGEDPRPEYPKYRLRPAPPTKHEIAFKTAEKECADVNGQWIWWSHGHGPDSYFYTMRCLRERPPARDPGWNQHLLPYEIHLTYDGRSHQITSFGRYSVQDLED